MKINTFQTAPQTAVTNTLNTFIDSGLIDSELDRVGRDQLMAQFSQALTLGKSNLIFVQNNDHLVGFAYVELLNIYGRVCLGIQGLYVSPDCRGHGVAQWLVSHLFSIAKAIPVITKCEPGLKAFYTRLGFGYSIQGDPLLVMANDKNIIRLIGDSE